MSSRRTINTLAVAALAAVALAAQPAAAFRMIQNTQVGRVAAGAAVPCNAAGGFTHWNLRHISWYLNPAGQGSNKAPALTAALNSWTNVVNADHTLNYAGTTTGRFATDGRNVVVFEKGNGCSGNCLALTALVLQSGQVIVETDVTFNSRFSWRTDGSDYDTEAVAAHEIGHSLGIHHTEVTNLPRPSMYATYLGTSGRTLEPDDNAALQCSETRY